MWRAWANAAPKSFRDSRWRLLRGWLPQPLAPVGAFQRGVECFGMSEVKGHVSAYVAHWKDEVIENPHVRIISMVHHHSRYVGWAEYALPASTARPRRGNSSVHVEFPQEW